MHFSPSSAISPLSHSPIIPFVKPQSLTQYFSTHIFFSLHIVASTKNHHMIKFPPLCSCMILSSFYIFSPLNQVINPALMSYMMHLYNNFQGQRMSKKNLSLIAYFLKSSPATQYNQFKSILTVKQGDKIPVPLFKRDQEYLSEFLDKIQVFGPSNANFSDYKSRTPVVDHLHKILPRKTLMEKPSVSSTQEPQQLFDSIRQVTQHSAQTIIPYQQLEQRLEIASPSVITQARNKLIYLFKLLLNNRQKIHVSTLEYEANYQLSRTIIAALKRAETDKNGQQNWKQLDAMEQLLSARQHKKQGFKEIAMNGLESICRNEEASAKTRLQALKVLCSSGEQLGDLTKLQSLVRDMRAKGEKEYQQIILNSIRRIKGLKE